MLLPFSRKIYKVDRVRNTLKRFINSNECYDFADDRRESRKQKTKNDTGHAVAPPTGDFPNIFGHRFEFRNARRTHVNLHERHKEAHTDQRSEARKRRHHQGREHRKRMRARNDCTEHGTAARIQEPVKRQLARFFKPGLEAHKHDRKDDRRGNRPAENLEQRRGRLDFAKGFFGRQRTVIFDNLTDARNMARTHDGENTITRSIANTARQVLVALVDQNGLHFGEGLAEFLHHCRKGILRLDFAEFFFGDFRLVEKACKERSDQRKLAVPRGAAPCPAERYLNISVGENGRNVRFTRIQNGAVEFRARTDARLHAHSLLVRAEDEVCNQSAELVLADNLAQIGLFPAVRVF